MNTKLNVGWSLRSGWMLVSCLIVFSAAHADSYVLDANPMTPSGMKGNEPFDKPTDPTVCSLYLRNLQYFARRNTPMSCERPIAPQFQDQIQKAEWENLKPSDYPELFRAVVGASQYWDAHPPKDEKFALRWYGDEVRKGAHAFRRAKIPLDGAPTTPDGIRQLASQRLWFVQYGPDSFALHNPVRSWRCEPRRGAPIAPSRTLLKTYLVSEDMKVLFNPVRMLQNGASGEALRTINGRIYFETAWDEGNIQLMELQDGRPDILNPVCYYIFKQSKP